MVRVAASGIGHSMADTRTIAGPNTQSQIFNGKVAVVFGDGIGCGLYPGQKIVLGNFHLLVRQGDIDLGAADSQHGILLVGLLPPTALKKYQQENQKKDGSNEHASN